MPRRSLRIGRAVLLAVVTAGVVLLGRASGLLDGIAGLLLSVLVILLVPTSRELSRRILLAGCLVLGWTQLLWWWELPLGGLGRVTVGLAVLVGALAAWVGAGARPGQRARLLLPRVRGVDLLVPAGAAVGAVLLSPWLQGKSLTQTFGLMLGGWDHSAHFSMVHMIRRFGVTVDALAPPLSGETWQFASYPQGYHAVVATIIEIVLGPRQASTEVELLAYSRAIALLVIVVTAVLIAGFCALPVLRRRPAVATPVAAFVAAVIYLGPGANAIQGGFGNFALACALVVALALVAVPLARVLNPLHLAAIGGALVGVATGWVLLLALAGPALLVVLLPPRRARWSASWLRVAGSVLVALLVIGSLLRTAAVVLRVQVANPLVLTGGIERPGFGLVAVSVMATLGACLLIRNRGGAGVRVTALGLVPLVGAVAAFGLAVMQVRANGEITYYGLKFMTGLEIVLLPVLMIPVAYGLARRVRVGGGASAGLRRGLAAACLAVAATQVFGLAVPDRPSSGLVPEAPGAVNRAGQVRALTTPPSTVDLAGRVIGHGEFPPHVYYLDTPSDRRVDPLLAAQWLFALTDSWTVEKNTAAGSAIVLPDDSPRSVAAVAALILRADPTAMVALRSEQVVAVERELDEPDLERRIIGL